MSPEEAEVIAWIVEGVARLDGKEAARRLVDTLHQILTGKDDALKQAAYEFIDDVVEAEEGAVEDGQQHLDSGA